MFQRKKASKQGPPEDIEMRRLRRIGKEYKDYGGAELLDAILSCRLLCANFRDYLHTILCSENLSCYLQIQKLKSSTSPELKIELAKHIISTYIKVGCAQEINIDDYARQNIAAELEKVTETEDVVLAAAYLQENDPFREVEVLLYQLMEKDSVPKYVSGGHMANFFAEFDWDKAKNTKDSLQVMKFDNQGRRTTVHLIGDMQLVPTVEEMADHRKELSKLGPVTQYPPLHAEVEYTLEDDKIISLSALSTGVLASLGSGALLFFSGEELEIQGKGGKGSKGGGKNLTVTSTKKSRSNSPRETRGRSSTSSKQSINEPTVLNSFNIGDRTYMMIPFPLRKEIVTITEKGQCFVWDSENLKVISEHRLGYDANSGRMIKAGVRCGECSILVCDTEGFVQMWDRDTMSISHSMQLPGVILCACNANDGVVWLGSVEYIFRFNGDGFRLLDKWEAHGSRKNVNQCIFLEKYKQVWTASDDGYIKVWSEKERLPVAQLDDHARNAAQVHSLACNDDKSIVFSGDFNGSVIVWDVRTLSSLQRVGDGALETIRSLVWFKDTLWVGSRSGILQVYRAKSEKKGGLFHRGKAEQSNTKLVRVAFSGNIKSSVVIVQMQEQQRKGKDYNCNLHLLHSCVAGDLDMVQYLIEHCGANVRFELGDNDSRSDYLRVGDTPISVAARFGSLEVEQYLSAINAPPRQVTRPWK